MTSAAVTEILPTPLNVALIELLVSAWSAVLCGNNKSGVIVVPTGGIFGDVGLSGLSVIDPDPNVLSAGP